MLLLLHMAMMLAQAARMTFVSEVDELPDVRSSQLCELQPKVWPFFVSQRDGISFGQS